MEEEHGMIRRTRELGCGRFVEECMWDAHDKKLSDIEHSDIVEFAARFEECSHSSDELHEMPDEELLRVAYWAMAEYASGQV